MGKERRDYSEIVQQVLESLKERPKAVNEIAVELVTGWDTVERCLKMLEKLQYVEKLVEKPITIYKLNSVVRIPNRLVPEIEHITKRRGARHFTFDEVVEEALTEFIRKEKSVKRY